MHITNRKQLKQVLRTERALYLPANRRKQLIQWVEGTLPLQMWRFQRRLRISEYLMTQKGPLSALRYRFSRRKLNKLGRRVDVEIAPGCFDEGLRIYHSGIVVNYRARIGKNCRLHGTNCIGNNGGDDTRVPIIGDNADIGVGACIIGEVRLGDNVKVGAGSVVTKSFDGGSVIVGVPAKLLKKGE